MEDLLKAAHLILHKANRLFCGVAAVDDHGLIQFVRKLQLQVQPLPLQLLIRLIRVAVIAVSVKADLAYPDRLRVFEHRTHPGKRRLLSHRLGFGHVVGVEACGKPKPRPALRKCPPCFARPYVAADIDRAEYTGRRQGVQHRLPVFVKAPVIIVYVGIEDHGCPLLSGRR